MNDVWKTICQLQQKIMELSARLADMQEALHNLHVLCKTFLASDTENFLSTET